MDNNKSNKMATLQSEYVNRIRQELKSDLSLSSVMEAPVLKKIVINIGLGEALKTPKVVDAAVADLSLISGQAAVRTKAKKSIAGFKLREGVFIGAMVTLRGKRMYEFLERLICFTLPRVRDFNGLNPKSFDKNGNYSFGVKEQLIFPEIDFDKVDEVRGMNITLAIQSQKVEHSIKLLEKFKFPIKK